MRLPPFLEQEIDFPQFYRVETNFPRPKLEDIESAVNSLLEKELPISEISKGDKVGIGVGSRGIANLARIIQALVKGLQQRSIHPIILPAMGSHGGATDEGQIKVLNSLGITEEKMECPIVSSLEVEKIGQVLGEVPVYFSRDALKLDHSICVNRIKPHTKFKGDVESGIMKMLCIGMAKHEGAMAYHRWALKHGFSNVLRNMAEEAATVSNFRFGIGIVENAFDETMIIEGLPAQNLYEQEAQLLIQAKQNMPSLPVPQTDVLIIDRIGKDISGAGMDPNITGRAGDLNEDDFSHIFKTTRLAILRLSEKTGGNALGMGNADVITEKLFQSLHYENTIMNVLTGLSLNKGKIPLRMPDDKTAIKLCFQSIGPIEPKAVKAILIKDTLTLSPCWVSEAIAGFLRENAKFKIGDKIQMPFDSNGTLTLFE